MEQQQRNGHELMLYNHSTDVVSYKTLQLPRMPARRPSSGERCCLRAVSSLLLGLLLGYLAASALSRSTVASVQDECRRLFAPSNRTLGPEELVLANLKVGPIYELTLFFTKIQIFINDS